ncbi:MAG: indolepyruvate oxidoreductase subunit beta [Bacteroidetes bacterium]|nr:indolepyruvate oxidoreductase subunit beta [Bacteroidota bacterium]
MKKDVILAGVGGQGILTISAIIGLAAVRSGLFLKQNEIHGMSQRGGDVHSNLRLSDKEIASDLIPTGKADIILSVEPMEGLRYLPMLASDGWLITSTEPFINIPNYPPIEDILNEISRVKHHIVIDAEKIAKDLGYAKAANMVILGAATPFLDMNFGYLEDAIREFFYHKGSGLIDTNILALKAGKEFTLSHS